MATQGSWLGQMGVLIALVVAATVQAQVPPPGPAMPVTATARLAPERVKAPLTISSAVSRLTAPYCSNVCARTPSRACLAS